MSCRRWTILVIVAVPVLVVLGTVVQTAWWYVGFRERLRLADEHAPVVRRVLEADPRFSEIAVESFTGNGGSLFVEAVAESGAAQDLKRLVESTSPPVPVKYGVYETDADGRRVSVDLSSR
jgi:hypothetical protein